MDAKTSLAIEYAQEWAKTHEEHMNAQAAFEDADRKLAAARVEAERRLYLLRESLDAISRDQTRVWSFALPDGKVAYVTMNGGRSTVLEPIK